MENKSKFEEVGVLFCNKNAKGDPVLRGSFKIDDITIKVIGFYAEKEGVKYGTNEKEVKKYFYFKKDVPLNAAAPVKNMVAVDSPNSPF